jgi:prolyl 4-hydroxylase
MSIVVIPPDWRSWIDTNRARNCTESSMLEAMCNAGIDAQLASTWLTMSARAAAAATTVAESAHRPTGTYRYEPSRLPPHNEVQLTDAKVRISMRIKEPDIALVENFLTPVECDELIALAQVKLQPSTIVDPDSGAFKPIAERSSHGAMFQRGETPLIQRVEERIAELIGWPIEKGEGLQVLHYKPGGEYRPHFDYFKPELPGSAVQMRGSGQRVATFIMYLNEVPDGGATIFPNIGLDVAPRRGTGVWFSYCNAEGQLDPATLHGGAPVVKGEKWIATKWLRQRAYGEI